MIGQGEALKGVYAEAWKELRFRRRLFWGLLFGWLPFGALVMVVWGRLLHLPDRWVPLVIIPYMLLLASSSLRLSLFQCPRCQGRFFMRGPVWFLSYHNTFTKSCLNCGLPEYATFNPGEDQQREFENRLPAVVAIFNFVYLPLLAGNATAGVLLLGKLGREAIIDESAKILWNVFSLTQAASLIFSMLTITSIRKPGLKIFITRTVPMWAKLALVLSFVGAIAIGAYSFFFAPPASTGLFGRMIPQGSLGTVMIASGLIAGMIAVFYTHQICRQIYLVRCPNSHEVPRDAVRCPTCGSLLP